ncbi:MAG TPA: fosfomycin resistance glutathione transferase [Edaphobacter sp.]
MISGINHITLSVRDLDESFRFYTEMLGLRPVARWYKGAYLEAGGLWVCLSLDEKVRRESLEEFTHLAFTVAQDQFRAAVERLVQAEVECWQQNRSEGDSFYFLDPNGHKLELHVGTLESRMRSLRESPPLDLQCF